LYHLQYPSLLAQLLLLLPLLLSLSLSLPLLLVVLSHLQQLSYIESGSYT
jgi:hypothetical protein